MTVTREYLIRHVPTGEWHTITFLDTDLTSTVQVVHADNSIGHLSVANAIDVLKWTSTCPDFEVVEV